MLPLARDRMVIGRAPESDIYISGDELVSRRHAELRRQGYGWVVTDLGSRNGTHVNGRRIRGSHTVQPGDSIRVGHTTLVLQESAPLAVAPPRDASMRAGEPFVRPSGPPKDPAAALILEVIPGLLGFLGIGWLYAGDTTRGLLILIGYWVFLVIEFVIGTTFSVLTLGLGACIALPLGVLVNLSIIGLSAYQLNNRLKHTYQVHPA